MSGTGQTWRLQALLPPVIRIDQLETTHPSPHTRTILGETGTGAADSTGRKWGQSQTGDAMGRSHFLAMGAAPTPGWGPRRDGAPSSSEKGSLKSQGLRLVKESSARECQQGLGSLVQSELTKVS